MHKYKLRKTFYFINIVTIIISIIAIFVLNDYIGNAIFVLCIVGSIFAMIDSLCTAIEFNEQVIIKKSLFKRTTISISEIEGILKMPTSKGKKICIGVFSSSKKIYITFWYVNFIQLLVLLVQQCESKGEVKIDESVKEIINNEFKHH